MKAIFTALIIVISFSARASDEITPNHQVNPTHAFKRLECFEEETRGTSGYTIAIDVPNGRDAEANVYFSRPGTQRSLVASWSVKYIVAPSVYATFANRFQKMDMSRSFEDLFSLNIQLHSDNGKNGIFNASFQSVALLGLAHRAEKQANSRQMTCRFQ